MGFPAFCLWAAQGGWSADSYAEIYCDQVKDKTIFIWPDNDKAGAELA
jgi:hypothetical protein